MKKIILFSLVLLSFLSCKKDKKFDVIKSFCYWKTDSYFGQEEDSLAKQMKLKHMYVRFFDVDWNPYAEEAQPVATVYNIRITDGLNITPSIFITNDVLLNSSKPQLDVLSERMAIRIKKIIDKYQTEKATALAYKIADADYERQKGNAFQSRLSTDSIIIAEKPKFEKDIQELLFDCDWTESSKDNYFYLLEKLKSKFSNYKISSTIRLWQYKYYEKAGIPPVDKGLLMCYNMTNPTEYNTKNSIGTSDELADYITHDAYPLELDIALPLFSWSVLFRGGEFKGVISEYQEFEKSPTIFKKTDDNKYTLQDDIQIGKFYARNGDEIKIEKISDDEIQDMIDIITEKVKISNTTKITFFSFDKKYINDYGVQNISKYYESF
ncbi:hypothetical protein [Flavobacterium sp.]|uniref:hypothetical protein n=1 Tax=Flavobacterium sp. TaxID=239 RepID=UPI002603C1C6|nr:hypothetical protein [Flavobacterium sp.]